MIVGPGIGLWLRIRAPLHNDPGGGVDLLFGASGVGDHARLPSQRCGDGLRHRREIDVLSGDVESEDAIGDKMPEVDMKGLAGEQVGGDGVTGEGRRQSNPRMESITDIAFLEDRVLVAGLSNEEFSSTLRAIPYPFKTVEGGTSVEIYHGAHGKFETKSPVRTFVPFMVGREPELLAAYTCTPLVRFPVDALKPGAKIRGTTIAELGNRNRPLDMIVYQKGGKDFLLLANSARGVMKISTDGLEAAGAIEEPVSNGGTQGQKFETVEGWTGVEQLDKLGDTLAVVLRKTETGSLNLESPALP